jgi:hypothetical protein
MKRIIITILFLIPLFSFGQQIQTDKKKYLEENLNLRMINNNLKLDTLKLRINIEEINRQYLIELEKKKNTIDSLNRVIKKIKDDNDSLIALKNQIFNLANQSVLLYKRECKKCEHNDIFFITLNGLDIIIKSNGVVLLKPIKDKKMWKTPTIYGVPYSENLGLHLYRYSSDPLNYDTNKLK